MSKERNLPRQAVRTSRWAIAGGALLLVVSPAHANDLEFNTPGLSLESYEPNTFGFTKDSDDVAFLDFTVSVKYQIFPVVITEHFGETEQLYAAFTGRFGQYLGTRESSPVIGKEFNPKLIWRHITAWDPGPAPKDKGKRAKEYMEFILAHDSNGQSINTPEQFQQAQAQAERPEFAFDRISRGWDYLGFIWKKVPSVDEQHRFSTYLILKYFLPHGPFQGAPEEFNDWETDPEGKPRKSVNGVGALLKYQWNWQSERWTWLSYPKVALVYETGYHNIFKYNTVRMEAGIKVSRLPLTVWARRGYGSDLAQYYKKVTSYGIELEIGSF